MNIDDAIKIVNSNKKKNENIYGAVQTNDLYIFNVSAEEDNIAYDI